MRPILRRTTVAATALLAVLGALRFGARFSDGPLGPFGGGPLSGTHAPGRPDWSTAGDTIELQIDPAHPWSVRTYAIPLDGELYVPSFLGPYRTWPGAALRDPRVVVRLGRTLYDRRLVQVTDATLRARVAEAMSTRHGYARDGIPARATTWYFHLAEPLAGGVR